MDLQKKLSCHCHADFTYAVAVFMRHNTFRKSRATLISALVDILCVWIKEKWKDFQKFQKHCIMAKN